MILPKNFIRKYIEVSQTLETISGTLPALSNIQKLGCHSSNQEIKQLVTAKNLFGRTFINP